MPRRSVHLAQMRDRRSGRMVSSRCILRQRWDLVADLSSCDTALEASDAAWQTMARRMQTAWRGSGTRSTSAFEIDDVAAPGFLCGASESLVWQTCSQAQRRSRKPSHRPGVTCCRSDRLQSSWKRPECAAAQHGRRHATWSGSRSERHTPPPTPTSLTLSSSPPTSSSSQHMSYALIPNDAPSAAAPPPSYNACEDHTATPSPATSAASSSSSPSPSSPALIALASAVKPDDLPKYSESAGPSPGQGGPVMHYYVQPGTQRMLATTYVFFFSSPDPQVLTAVFVRFAQARPADASDDVPRPGPQPGLDAVRSPRCPLCAALLPLGYRGLRHGPQDRLVSPAAFPPLALPRIQLLTDFTLASQPAMRRHGLHRAHQLVLKRRSLAQMVAVSVPFHLLLVPLPSACV